MTYHSWVGVDNLAVEAPTFLNVLVYVFLNFCIKPVIVF